MTAVSEPCDIAIVGGGLVGSLLALALAEQHQTLLEGGCQPWRVTLLERHAMAAQPLHGDSALAGRSTALSESTRQLLLKLGLWSHIEPHCAPISTIHVSERGSWGVTRLEASESGLAALGYVVENQPLLAELHRALASTAVTVRAPVAVVGLSAGRQQQLQLSDGVLTSALVVSAEGSDSQLLAAQGIHWQRSDYQQQAIIANLSLAQPHQGVAYERFAEGGPVALLPLPDSAGLHRMALVWTHPEGQQQYWLDASDSEFCQRLEQLFGERIGAVTAVGERRAFALGLQRSSEQVRRGLVVLGNAAHTLHPVAGQGFNLSVRDVAALADELLAARLDGAEAGDLAALERYRQRQQCDQQQTIAFSHWLPKLFASRWPGAALLRRSGLAAMEGLTPLRQRFAAFGMGSDRGVLR